VDPVNHGERAIEDDVVEVEGVDCDASATIALPKGGLGWIGIGSNNILVSTMDLISNKSFFKYIF
jgi:hypothetical protein